MTAYQRQKERNAALQEQLSACQKELSEQRAALEAEKLRYQQLRTARMLEVSGDDVKESRARIARLIREVDKCIALLDI